MSLLALSLCLSLADLLFRSKAVVFPDQSPALMRLDSQSISWAPSAHRDSPLPLPFNASLGPWPSVVATSSPLP